ncbi:MAG: glycosyltransferase family 1 protein [Frankiales bacterium]|nr:MAG: glycosyltransferase family 1 protein [Frankiales bacterium]
MHTGLHLREVESYEIYETVAGLAAAAATEDVVLQATDGRHLYDARRGVDGELEYVRCGSVLDALRRRYDVAHVHMVLPQTHLLLAFLLRVRGVPVVLSPMSMLGDDFGGGSWFRHRRPALLRVKPHAVRLMGVLWRLLAAAFVVQSAEEARLAHLPRQQVALLPLPAPRTPLADAVLDVSRPAGGEEHGPLAFVSRLDTWRKGLDRLCAWLETHAEELPRPAAVLYAPEDGSPRPDVLPALVEQGLLRWDTTSRGADLVRELERARGVVLLSRWDGQPRVLREAALLGIPTMSTPASHFTEVVQALGSGVLVQDADDPHEVHRAFCELAGQPRDAAAARRLFHRDGVGRSLLLLLRHVAAKQPVDVDHYRAFTTVAGS